MIIYRYLCKEVMLVLFVVVCLLLLILLSNQVVHYLRSAAEGRLAYAYIIRLLALQIPQLLVFLIPLSLYLSLVWCYGRLQANHELMMISICGVSALQFFLMTLRIVLGVALFNVILVFWLQPIASFYRYQVLSNSIEFSPLKRAGSRHFQSILGDKWAFYVNEFSKDHRQMSGIFLARQQQGIGHAQFGADSAQDYPSNQTTSGIQWEVVTAKHGNISWIPKLNGYFLVLSDGQRYQEQGMTKTYRMMQYQYYGIQMPGPKMGQKGMIESSSLAWLWKHYKKRPYVAAVFYLRLSSSISIFLASMMALLFLKLIPSCSHFLRLVFAMLGYITYVSLQLIGKAWVQSSQWGMWHALGLVHGLVALLMIVLMIIQYCGFIRNRCKIFSLIPLGRR